MEVTQTLKNIKERFNYCKELKAIDDEAVKKGFVEAINRLLLCDENVLNSFIKTLELRKSRVLDAMIDGSISKDDYNVKTQEINDCLFELNRELIDAETMSKKKEAMRDKLIEFANMVEKGNVLDEFGDRTRQQMHEFPVRIAIQIQ